MTAIELLESLASGLRSAVKGLKYPAQYQENKAVTVYLQSIPVAEHETDTFYPLILIELLGIEDDVEKSTASILITIITYDSDGRGFYDNFNIAERVRRWILTNRLLESFALEVPLTFGVVEKTEDDFWASNFLATYQLMQPDSNYDIEDIV